MHSIRVAAKVIIGFLFSITVLLTFLTVSLFGVQAEDRVRIIVTEATGLRRDMVFFYADLQPLVIHNVLWFCLAAFGFMLIFLYFIDHSFKGFLGPGVLSLVITFFIVIVITLSWENIFHFTGVISELYIQTALDRFKQGAFGMTAFGFVLVAVSMWGDRIFQKIKK